MVNKVSKEDKETLETVGDDAHMVYRLEGESHTEAKEEQREERDVQRVVQQVWQSGEEEWEVPHNVEEERQAEVGGAAAVVVLEAAAVVLEGNE